MAKTKVRINRAAWGREVMASPGMGAFLMGEGSKVAAKVPGGKTIISTSGVAGGGSRARAMISGTVTLADEAETGQMLSALKSVVPSGHRESGSSTERLAQAKARTSSKAGRTIRRQRRKGVGS